MKARGSGGSAGRYRALARSEPNEEKETDPKHKTSDTSVTRSKKRILTHTPLAFFLRLA